MHHDKPYESASAVFGSFSNESGWSSSGTVFVIGWMLSTVNVGLPFSGNLLRDTDSEQFLGLDSVTHFSVRDAPETRILRDSANIQQEEMKYPEAEVPRAMIGAISIGLATGFGFLIAILFCITNFDEVSSINKLTEISV